MTVAQMSGAGPLAFTHFQTSQVRPFAHSIDLHHQTDVANNEELTIHRHNHGSSNPYPELNNATSNERFPNTLAGKTNSAYQSVQTKNPGSNWSNGLTPSHDPLKAWNSKPDTGTLTILKVPTNKKEQTVLDLVKTLDKEGVKAAEKVRKKEHHFSNGENQYPANGVTPFGMTSSSENGISPLANSNQHRASTSGENGTVGSHFPEKGKGSTVRNEYQRQYPGDDCHRQMQQGRVPWNLAGLVGHLGPDSGSGLSHYSPHYPPPNSGGGHNSHLLGHPGSSHEQSSLWAMGMHPGLGPPGSGEGPPDALGLSYKSLADPMSMYYASQHSIQVSSGGPSVSASGLTPSSSSGGLGGLTTTTSLTSSISTETLVNSFQALNSIEPGDMMQPLHSYFGGQSDMPISEEHASWIDPSHSAAAAVVAAAVANQSHHGLDAYHSEYSIPRLGNSYTNRKKNIIKEWTKNHTPTSSGSNGQPGNPDPGSSRSFLPNDFAYPSSSISPYASIGISVKDENNGIRDYSPYGLNPYAAYSELVNNPYAHHHSMLGHHSAGHHLQHAQQMAMSLGGIGGAPHQGSSSAEALTSPSLNLTKRERKRKSENKSGNAIVHPPLNLNGHAMTRDERKAMTLGLPISVADIIHLPMDEFNDLLSKHELSEDQLALCRDIRRRGKNKVAARNCRRRKIDQIKQLEDDVTRIRCRKTELLNEFEKLSAQRIHWSDMVKRLHDHVLKELGHDPSQYQLQMDHNRQVHILPRSQLDDAEQSKAEHPYHYAPHLGPTVMATISQNSQQRQ